MAKSKDKRRQIAKLFERDGDLCALCLEPIDPANVGNHPDAVSMDHIKTKRDGGGNCLNNLVLAHRLCNARRAHRPFVRGMFATVAPDPAPATLADVWPEIEALL